MTCTDSCRRPVEGTKQAHCSVCHKTFSAVTWFDIHRIGGRCKDVPGLINKNGLWATKERHEQYVQMAARLAELREKDQRLL